MRIENLFSGINTKGLNKICPEISYTKETLEKIKKYNNFKNLLEHNKTIKKGSGKKLTIEQTEEITNIGDINLELEKATYIIIFIYKFL
ncbi:MAG: hypothetical protein LBG48_01610 [Rickettsiales bacterium]|jgi:hypothetical protein|nr:hypothetical protein [Rickettsiales bacterium]